MRRRGVLAVGLVAALVACAVARSDEPLAWVDRPASDLDALFGPADKAKRRGDGSTRLTYKVYLLAERPESPAGLVAIELPGVGWIGRPIVRVAPAADVVGIDPIELDESGQRTGSGTGRTESYERSIGKGEASPAPAPDPPPMPPHRGKLKLIFEVGADGLVDSWTVSPRPR